VHVHDRADKDAKTGVLCRLRFQAFLLVDPCFHERENLTQHREEEPGGGQCPSCVSLLCHRNSSQLS
jgi:hypothetical protein